MDSQPRSSPVKFMLGIDFDNTIINYDEIMYTLALNVGLIDSKIRKNKKEIKDAIRKRGGDLRWQEIQAQSYGKEIAQAVLNPGVWDFLMACKQQHVLLSIISHKTLVSNLVQHKVNLREAALSWMEKQGFFSNGGIGLEKDQIYFESSREEKINCIKKIGCNYFIDDLEEVFTEPSFPKTVKKILYIPHPEALPKNYFLRDVTFFFSWQEIRQFFIKEGVLSERNE